MIINMTSGGVMPERILDAHSITPGTQNQVIEEGTYLRGPLTILGDPDLKADNIREGINIFNILGAVSEGISGIEIGEMTITGRTVDMTFSHNLKRVPKVAILLAIENITYYGYATVADIAFNTAIEGSTKGYRISYDGAKTAFACEGVTASNQASFHNLTASSVTFTGAVWGHAIGKYMWIVA